MSHFHISVCIFIGEVTAFHSVQQIQNKTFCQNHHHALTLSRRVGTVTKCSSSWHFTSHLSDCLTESAGFDGKCNHEDKPWNILIFPLLQNEPRLMSALRRSSGVQRCGLTQWQGNISHYLQNLNKFTDMC